MSSILIYYVCHGQINKYIQSKFKVCMYTIILKKIIVYNITYYFKLLNIFYTKKPAVQIITIKCYATYFILILCNYKENEHHLLKHQLVFCLFWFGRHCHFDTFPVLILYYLYHDITYLINYVWRWMELNKDCSTYCQIFKLIFLFDPNIRALH